MPHAKTTRIKEKKPEVEHEEELVVPAVINPVKAARIPDIIEEGDEAPVAEEGAVAEEADADESLLAEDEESDPTEANPFGDRWEE